LARHALVDHIHSFFGTTRFEPVAILFSIFGLFFELNAETSGLSLGLSRLMMLQEFVSSI